MTEQTQDQNSQTETPESELQNIVEAALYAADEPLSVRKLQALFLDGAQPEKDDIVGALDALKEQYQTRGLELVKAGGGWRFQTREKYATWMRRIQTSKTPRFSRAQLETMAIIAYRQPVTRGDIEEVRGVAVSSDIIRLLEERGWIREIGHRDVPGRPALFGTTQEFLAYFNLQSLRELPELIEKRKFEEIAQEMHMQLPEDDEESDSSAEGDEEQTSAEVIPLHGDKEQEASEEDSDKANHKRLSADEEDDFSAIDALLEKTKREELKATQTELEVSDEELSDESESSDGDSEPS